MASFLPRLDTLHLEGFPFTKRSLGADEHRLVDIAAMFIEQRAAAGKPLHILDLDDCDLEEGQLQRWQKWVEDLREHGRPWQGLVPGS